MLENENKENEITQETIQEEQKEIKQKEIETTVISDTSEPAPKKQIKIPKNLSFQMTKELKIVSGVALAAVLIVGILSYRTGYESKIDSETLKLYAQYEEAYEKLENTKQEIKKSESTLKELEDYKKNKESLNAQLSSVSQEIDTKNGELQGLTSQVEQKQQELDKLNGDIIQAKGQPISLSAGQFVVGHDIPANRYNVSGSSNFIVYNSNGKLKVNTILGDRYGSGDYVCMLSSGDVIDNHAKATFTPIE